MNNNENDRNNIAWLNREGESLFQRGDVAGAVARFEQALALNDVHPETLNNLGVGHLHLGDADRALHYLVRGLDSHPQNPELVANACVILRQLGCVEDAERLVGGCVAQTTSMGPDPVDRDSEDAQRARDMRLARCSVAENFEAGMIPLGERPLVTVIVIACGDDSCVQHALDSVAAQDYQNWEAVVIAGHNSTDSSLDPGGHTDVRIHYLGSRAANTAAARNAALRAARGDIICYLNDTDTFLPDHLSTVIATLRDGGAPFVYTGARLVSSVVRDGERETMFTDQLSSNEAFARDRILIQNPIAVTSWAHRAGFVECLGGFDESLSALEDWDLLLRFSSRYAPVSIPRVTVEIHRQHGAVDLASLGVTREHACAVYEELYQRYPVTDPAAQRARSTLLRQLVRDRGQQMANSQHADMDALYPVWVEKHQLSEADGQILAERMMTAWRHRPTVELLTVAAEHDDSRLQETVASLRRQLYKNWRLTVICAAPLQQCKGMQRSQLRWVRHGGDPVAALNRVAASTTRDWIALIDPGDRLPPHSLFACADYINLHPGWRLLYTDEDEMDDAGDRHDPKFKPDFNLDLLRSTAYIGRFCLVYSETWRSLGGVTGIEGGETYDLTLKTLDRFGENSIGHIADVLYHRLDTNSKRLDGDSRSRCELLALRAHLDRNGVRASVEPGYLDGTYFIEYRHDESPPLVSIIVPTRNKLEYLRPCINSVLETTSCEFYELIIVDNDSDDPQTLEFLSHVAAVHDRVRVLRYPHPFNYSAIMNWAAAEARGEYLLLLNNDTHVVHGNWLERMLNHGLRSEVGAVGARLIYADKRLQHAGVVTGIHDIADHVFLKLPMDQPGHLGRAQCVQNYSAVTAACMLVRKSVYLEVGGMDEKELAVLYNDVDLCLKIGGSGHKIVWTPYATLIHHGSRSVREHSDKSDLVQRKSEAHSMVRRWLPSLPHDPAYNRNLTLSRCDSRLETQVDVTWDPCFHDRPRVLAFPFHRWGSGEYRVRAPMRALHDAGCIQYALMPLNDTHRAPHLCELERVAPDVLLLHNTLHDEHLKLLSLYKQYSSAYRVFGQDDLISALPPKNPYRKSVYPDIEQRIRRALSLCDRLVVSTEPLASAFSTMIDDIVVLPNYIERSRWAGLRSRRRRGPRPRIGWAGAQQHQGDLELLIDVVAATRGDADWVFMGMCPEQIRPLCAEYHSGVTIDRYPEKLASLDLDLAVAPLEVHPFNECKSNLRLLEYGMLGWPVVCSDIAPYYDAPVRRIPNNPEAWIAAIRERIHDLDAAAKEGDLLRDWVRDNWILEDHLDEWLGTLLPAHLIVRYSQSPHARERGLRQGMG